MRSRRGRHQRKVKSRTMDGSTTDSSVLNYFSHLIGFWMEDGACLLKREIAMFIKRPWRLMWEVHTPFWFQSLKILSFSLWEWVSFFFLPLRAASMSSSWHTQSDADFVLSGIFYPLPRGLHSLIFTSWEYQRKVRVTQVQPPVRGEDMQSERLPSKLQTQATPEKHTLWGESA